jgi:hypothetical protein
MERLLPPTLTFKLQGGNRNLVGLVINIDGKAQNVIDVIDVLSVRMVGLLSLH